MRDSSSTCLKLLQIGLLFGCILSLQKLVAPGVSPELGDEVQVLFELYLNFSQYRDVLFISRHAGTLVPQVLDFLFDDCDGELAIVGVFAESQWRQYQEHLVVGVHLIEVRLQDYVPADLDGVFLELKGPLISLEHVFGEELKHYDDRQHTIRVIVPVIKFTLSQPFEVYGESDRNLAAIVPSPLPQMPLFLKDRWLWRAAESDQCLTEIVAFDLIDPRSRFDRPNATLAESWLPGSVLIVAARAASLKG